jgi:hypothetical protein
MTVILATEVCFKARKLNALRLLGVLLGLGDLPDHA